MPNIPEIPHLGSAQTLTRFFLRLVILSVFATLGRQGFRKTLESLLILGALYCIFVAAVRREYLFGPLLTHFDEAAAYVVIAGLAAWIL